MFRTDESPRPVLPAAARFGQRRVAPAAPVLELDTLADPPVPGGITAWRQQLGRIDLVANLAEDIGSRRWLRGMGTMVSLIAAALAFWPDFSRLDAAPAMRLDDGAAAEFRAQAIMPLAHGGESGHRMGPSHRLRAVPYVPERAEIALSSVLAQGDSLARLFQRAGAAPEDAGHAAALVAAALPEGGVAPGTRISFVLGPRPAPGRPRPLHGAMLRARFDLALAVHRAGSGLALERRPIPVDETPLRIRGTVGESLYRSARAAGAPPQAIQQYLQALDSHLNLEGDVRSDDSFDLVFAMKRAATGETEVGDLVYAGLDRGAQPVAELLRWEGGAFYSASAFSSETVVQGGGMLLPVNARITSIYGQRVHPILGYARMHAGVDFGAASGTPIVATAPGVVAYAGYRGGHGNYVRLEHGSGLGTGYGHMSRIAVGPGERVNAGEVIGYVGSTGLSTGPHLHYEMYRNGRTVNPLGVSFATMTRQVDTRDLDAFRAKLAQMKALKPGRMLASAPARVQRIAMR